MADFKDENGVCLVCHPKRLGWRGNWHYTELDDRAKYMALRVELWGNDLKIVAYGDDKASYCPKFCPECGRRLKEEADNGT